VTEPGRRGDADLREIDAGEDGFVRHRAENLDRGLKARADGFLRALQLEGAGDDSAELAQLGPFRAERVIAPRSRQVEIELEMGARALAIAVTAEPSFFGGEAKDRREPAYEAFEDPIEDGTRRAPHRRGRQIAIERILAHIEIKCREIDRAEIVDRGEHRVEIEFRRGLAHQRVELRQAMENEALELGHRRRLDALRLAKAGEGTKQITQRVAQAAIDVTLVFQDLAPHGHVFGVIRIDDPEPQDVGPDISDHLRQRLQRHAR
jgi:hypothetical protein